MVAEKHSGCLLKNWVTSGTTGMAAVIMRRMRAFKLALDLRYCRQHCKQIKMDECATFLFNNDSRKFWQHMNRMRNTEATK